MLSHVPRLVAAPGRQTLFIGWAGMGTAINTASFLESTKNDETLSLRLFEKCYPIPQPQAVQPRRRCLQDSLTRRDSRSGTQPAEVAHRNALLP